MKIHNLVNIIDVISLLVIYSHQVIKKITVTMEFQHLIIKIISIPNTQPELLSVLSFVTSIAR